MEKKKWMESCRWAERRLSAGGLSWMLGGEWVCIRTAPARIVNEADCTECPSWERRAEADPETADRTKRRS